MGTKMRVSAAVLVAAVIVYFVARTPQAESPPVAAVEPPAADVELVGAAAEDPATEAVQRILVAEEPPGGVSAVAGTNVLRVVLEGITEENARMTRVTLTGGDKRTFDRRLATPDQWRAYVQWIQRSLNRVLGTGSAVDGQLGPRTREAIITFQRREGLPTSGRVDPKTEGALIRYDGTHSYAPKWPAEIRGSWPCQGLTSQFDLDPFFASVAERHENLRVDELEVNVDHPLHLLERIRVPLSRGVELKSGRTVFEVRVRLVPASVIHGRLVRENGAPAAEGLVGALLLEETTWERPTTNGSTLSDVPIEDEGRAVECAADGAFELRVRASGRYALVSYEEGRRPTTTRVEALVGTRVDLGTIVLEFGHAITGRALRHGNPMAGASVSLTQPRTFWAADPADVENGMNAWIRPWRTFTTRARSVTLAWLESRFELVGQRASVDESGAFVFGGLAALEYRLRVVELPESRFLPSGWDNTGFGEEGPDEMVVRAPAHGVVLEYNWTSIRFELEGDLESDDAGRLILRTKSLYRGNEFTSIPEYWSAQFPLSGDEPTFVLQAPSTVQMLGEVMFPGRQLVPLDFRTPEPGGEVVVPVELVRAEDAATLVIELENPQAEIPETFTVMLKRAGQADTPETRTVEVREGQLRMEGIVPGQYRVVVCACEDPNHPGLFFRNEFELELHPGQAATRSTGMRQGAGLRLTLRDEDGELLGGHYEFYDHVGSGVGLVLVDSERWKPGSDAFATTGGFGPAALRSSEPIHPGRYRLVLISPGYANRSVTVELRAGEYEDVDVTLSK